MTFVREHMGQMPTETKDISQPSWHEKLDEWDLALVSYEQHLETNPRNFEMALGRMRCLDNLGTYHAVPRCATVSVASHAHVMQQATVCVHAWSLPVQ